MYNTDLPKKEDLPTSAKLLRSTIMALGVALVIIVTVILPAEYGIDPTRIGRALGFTQMGEIKTQLAEEAAREDAAEPIVESTAAAITKKQPDVAEDIRTAQATAPATPEWRDETSLMLAPGDAAEVKLTMNKGEIAEYEWTVSAGHLNSDLHGDAPGDQFISYRKGRAETGDTGEFAAAFEGSHGWYWRNRSDVAVEVTLRVRGQYTEIKRVL